MAGVLFDMVERGQGESGAFASNPHLGAPRAPTTLFGDIPVDGGLVQKGH
jgi:hypothetical protein